ncbi:MAG: glycosyltransferase [Bacillota bacterium]
MVIPAKNEAKTIERVIMEAGSVTDSAEIIVVCNGSNDQSADMARKKGARIIWCEEDLGYDVGRAIGAKYANGEIILFLDADYVVPALTLRELYLDVKRGYDVVLNKYSGFRSRVKIHVTSQAKRLLNKYLAKDNLIGSSMTTTPHALSRRALETIGYHALAVPPLALAKAALNQLKIHRSARIDVGRFNKRKPNREEVKDLIMGDHAEAIAYLIRKKGIRGGFADFQRHREVLDLIEHHVTRINDQDNGRANNDCLNLSVVIPALNEEKTIGPLITNLKQLRPKEILVVENGSTDQTLRVCYNHGVKILSFTSPLGHDVGRAIGAKEAKGDYILFLDGDIIFTPEELRPYVNFSNCGADILLNNINPFFMLSSMIDYISMANALLNSALSLPQLQYSSLTSIPHVIRRSAVNLIGFQNLAVPPKALAIAVLKGLKIQQAAGINVLVRNPVREHNRRKKNKIEELILGDHLEAIEHVQSVIGNRLFLPDTNRRRYLIDHEWKIM